MAVTMARHREKILTRSQSRGPGRIMEFLVNLFLSRGIKILLAVILTSLITLAQMAFSTIMTRYCSSCASRKNFFRWALSAEDIMRSPFIQSSISRPLRCCCSKFPQKKRVFRASSTSAGGSLVAPIQTPTHSDLVRRAERLPVPSSWHQTLAVTRCDVNFSLNMASCEESAFGFFAVRNIPGGAS